MFERIRSSCWSLFDKLSLREKGLFLAVLWFAVIWWAIEWKKRSDVIWNQSADVSAKLETQNSWLDNANFIEEELKTQIEKLDPNKTLSEEAFFGKVDEIVRNAKFSEGVKITPGKSTSDDVFNVHILNVNFRNVEIAPLIKFNDLLKKENPYIALKDIRVTANKSKPQLLTADMAIVSFELQSNSIHSNNQSVPN